MTWSSVLGNRRDLGYKGGLIQIWEHAGVQGRSLIEAFRKRDSG